MVASVQLPVAMYGIIREAPLPRNCLPTHILVLLAWIPFHPGVFFFFLLRALIGLVGDGTALALMVADGRF